MGEWKRGLYHRPLTPKRSTAITREMLVNAGIGRSYWPCSIGQIPDSCEYKKALRSMVRDLHLDAPEGRGALFFGNHGYGKTSAADIMLMAAMSRGGQCFHRMAAQVEHAYTKRWVETNLDGVEIWDLLVGSQLLVLDDLGHELAASGYKAGDTRIVEELIRLRYDDRLTTYITTNLPLPELIKIYQPISSILLDPTRFRIVEVSGHNWRRGKNGE